MCFVPRDRPLKNKVLKLAMECMKLPPVKSNALLDPTLTITIL